MFPVVNGRKQCYILPMELQTKTLSIFGKEYRVYSGACCLAYWRNTARNGLMTG